MDNNNHWRSEERRQKIINKIVECLGRHCPQTGLDSMNELKKIAVRFEEKVYTSAANQQDYLRRLSLKMLSLESKANVPLGNCSPGSSSEIYSDVQKKAIVISRPFPNTDADSVDLLQTDADSVDLLQKVKIAENGLAAGNQDEHPSGLMQVQNEVVFGFAVGKQDEHPSVLNSNATTMRCLAIKEFGLNDVAFLCDCGFLHHILVHLSYFDSCPVF